MVGLRLGDGESRPARVCLDESTGAARNNLANWGNAFLPGAHTGTYVNIHEMSPEQVMHDLTNNWLSKVDQRHQADLLTKLNQMDLQRQHHDSQLEASIQTMEMAFRIQFAVPDAFDTSQESKETLEMYGDSKYAKGYLLARRLIERGVRTVQLSHSIDGYDSLRFQAVLLDDNVGAWGQAAELADEFDFLCGSRLLALRQDHVFLLEASS